MIYKRCSRCNKRVLEGQQCSCLKDRHKEYKRTRTDNKEQRFYTSNDWITIRDQVKDSCDNVDLYSYYVRGVIEYADTTHHIIELKEDWSKRLDKDNLICLTESNHQQIHKIYRQGGKDKTDIVEVLRKIVKQHAIKSEE